MKGAVRWDFFHGVEKRIPARCRDTSQPGRAGNFPEDAEDGIKLTGAGRLKHPLQLLLNRALAGTPPAVFKGLFHLVVSFVGIVKEERNAPGSVRRSRKHRPGRGGGTMKGIKLRPNMMLRQRDSIQDFILPSPFPKKGIQNLFARNLMTAPQFGSAIQTIPFFFKTLLHSLAMP